VQIHAGTDWLQTGDVAWRWELSTLLACALILRLALAWGVQGWVERTPGRLCLVAGDAEGYWELARNLVERGEFSLYTPPRRVLRMPGFPLWLAGGWQLFGERVLWHRFGLAGLGALACGLTWLCGCLWGGRVVGRWAGWLAALHPGLAALSVLLLSETLFACCLTASLVILTRWLQALTGGGLSVGTTGDSTTGDRTMGIPNPTGRPLIALAGGQPSPVAESRRNRQVWLWAGLFGVSCGVATLVRPTWLPVAPVAVGCLWIAAPVPRSRLLAPSLAVAAGLALTLLPWVVRNHRAVGHPVVTSLWAGASLYDGLHPGATGLSDMRFIEDDGLFTTLSEFEVDRHYRQAALRFARENPGRVLELARVKLSRFWSPWLNAGEVQTGPLGWALGAFEVALWLAGLVGLWRWRTSGWRVLLAVGPLLFLSLVHCLFVGSVRYRLPAEYPLLPAAALGLLTGLGRGDRFPGTQSG